MNLQLAFKIVNVCFLALSIVNRTLIIVENAQKPNVRGKRKPSVTPIRPDSSD